MEPREQQLQSLQIEVREYGEVSTDLIDLARTGIAKVLKELGTPQTKPLTLHITEGIFETQYGEVFIEIYERLPNQGNMFIAYDNGYRQKYRQQIEERYGIPADSPPKYLFLYSVCHSAVHYVQHLQGKFVDTQLTDASQFNPNSPEYIQKQLEDPLEQEAHKKGLEVSNSIIISSPIIQVQIENPKV